VCSQAETNPMVTGFLVCSITNRSKTPTAMLQCSNAAAIAGKAGLLHISVLGRHAALICVWC